MTAARFTSADEWHTWLRTEAIERVEKLTGKVGKLEQQLADARAAVVAAEAEAEELRTNPPAWVEPTEHAVARVDG